MADKFLRHGETYCGDGTTSIAAASNGAPGAWNNINVLEGSAPAYGSLSAGDVVYIRSKDAGGANITRTVTGAVSLGSSSGTEAAPVRWILDAGDKWPGVSGVLKYTHASTHTVTILGNNVVEATVQDALVIECTNTNPAYAAFVVLLGVLKRALLDTFAKTGPYAYSIDLSGIADSCHFKIGAQGYSFAVRVQPFVQARLINPDIELLSVGNAVIGPQDSASYAIRLDIVGGRVRGAGATSGQTLINIGSDPLPVMGVKIMGLDVPKAMTLSTRPYSSGAGVEGSCLDGTSGAELVDVWGSASSRSDNNPPTLNAVLPDSANTPWSWKVYPAWASEQRRMRLVLHSIYAGTADQLAVTLELLVATTFPALDKRKLWIDVNYVDDADGVLKQVSSRTMDGGALDASSAAWAFDTWGVINFNKRKLTVTTPGNVRQNTPVTITLYGTVPSASANDLLFVCPAAQVEAV